MSHPPSILFSIFLAENEIGPEEAKHFIEGLKLNTTLKKLDFGGFD
jgi:hypothetical protein